MNSPFVCRSARAALLLLGCGPLQAAPDATLRYPSANDAALNTVVWMGSQFVAAGQGGVIFTSPDGTTWTSRHTPLAADWRDSAAGGGKVVITGDASAVVTSADGVAWTVQPFDDLPYARADVAAWNGSNFMIGRRWISPDGSTWTKVTFPQTDTGTLQGLTANGSQFVAFASYNVSNVDKQRLWTFSGGAWTPVELTTTKLQELTWTGTRYIAIGPGGIAATSVDGIAWTPRTTGVTADLKQVIQGGSMAVAVGDGGTILTSPNGATWTVQTSGTTRNLKSVAWSGTLYAAVGEGGLILTSPNGSEWDPAKTGTPQTVEPDFVGWAGPSGLAVGKGNTLFSADGNTWVKTAATGGPGAFNTMSRPRFRMAAGGGEVRVVVTDMLASFSNYGRGGIWSAPLDGSSWSGDSSREGFAVFRKGMQFDLLTVRRETDRFGFFYYYYDAPEGIDTGEQPTDLVWTGQSYMTTRGTWNVSGDEWDVSNVRDNAALFWTGDKFIGVTTDGQFRTSADGLTWPAAQYPIAGGADDVLWTGSRLLAVNDYGVYEATTGGPWQLVSRVGGQSIAWTGTRALIASGNKILSLEGVGLSSFGLWLGTYFTPAQLVDPAVTGQLADPDHDGQPNIIEYATGTDPSNTAQRPALTVEHSPAGVRFRWPEDTSRTDVRVTPQVTFDLDAWDDLTGTPVSGTTGGVRLMETPPLPIQRAAFFRLKVQSLE